MRILYLASFLLLLLAAPAIAQTPQYFITGGTSNNNFPLNSTTSNKVQWIYHPSNFPGAPMGNITHIYLNVGTAPAGGSSTFTNFTVKMGYTAASTTVTGPFTTGLTTVKGPMTFSLTGITSGNWIQIPLTTPFFWDGSQNFIVEVSQTAYVTGFSVKQNSSTALGNRRIWGLVTSATGTAGAGLADFGFDIIPGSPCVNATGVTSSNITQISADFSWTAPATTTGYEYAVTTTPAFPSSGTTTTSTTANLTGLNANTNYYFHLRNYCTSTSYSVWSTTPFTTLPWPPCPSTGTPWVTNNVPGSATAHWNSASVIDYQYVINQSATPPTGGFTTTTDTFANATGLIPGAQYYVHVRSNCSVNTSGWQTYGFINPFPPCHEPANIFISNVNMNGAEIAWNSSTTVPPAAGYQYEVSTNPAPPAAGTPTTDTTHTALNLTGGTTYYVHVRTHCGTTNYSVWATESFTTPSVCLGPDSVSITNITHNSAIITWNTYPGVSGYEYHINTSPAAPTFTGQPILYNAISPLSLNSGTTYYFHLRTRCDSNIYSAWMTTPFTTLVNCTAPTAPIVTSMSSTSASLSWGSVSGAMNYEYALDTTTAPPAFGTATSQTNFTATGLSPNTFYCLHVRAICSTSDISTWSTQCFTTNPTGIEEVATNGLLVDVFPNPVSEAVTVKLTGNKTGSARVLLTDLSGKINRVYSVDQNELRIDVRDLAAGIYILKYADDVNSSVFRIQKL